MRKMTSFWFAVAVLGSSVVYGCGSDNSDFECSEHAVANGIASHCEQAGRFGEGQPSYPCAPPESVSPRSVLASRLTPNACPGGTVPTLDSDFSGPHASSNARRQGPFDGEFHGFTTGASEGSNGGANEGGGETGGTAGGDTGSAGTAGSTGSAGDTGGDTSSTPSGGDTGGTPSGGDTGGSIGDTGGSNGDTSGGCQDGSGDPGGSGGGGGDVGGGDEGGSGTPECSTGYRCTQHAKKTVCVCVKCNAGYHLVRGACVPKGNNGVGNGVDPQPPGNPPVNDGPGTSPGNPGNKGGV